MKVLSAPLTPKQRSTFTAYLTSGDRYRYFLLKGGVRTGKTNLATLLLLCEMYRLPRQRFILLGKNYSSVLANCKPYLEQYMPLFGFQSSSFKANPIRISGRELFVASANDSQSFNTIAGKSAAGALIDEATRCDEMAVKTTLDRCTDVPQPKIIMTLNPTTQNNWINRRFDVPAPANVFKQKFSLVDNTALSQATIDDILGRYTGADYTRLIEGDWANETGRIYPNLPTLDSDPGASEVLDLYVMVDPGYGDPYAALYFLETAEGHVVIDEYYETHEYVNHNPFEHVEKVHLKMTELEQRYGVECSRLDVDPSATGDRQAYRDKIGMGRKALNNSDSTKATGCKLVRTQLDKGRVKIHNRCVNLLREAESYFWSETQEDMPEDGNDHTLDALRYGVNRKFRRQAA